MFLWLESQGRETYVHRGQECIRIQQKSVKLVDSMCREYGRSYEASKEAAVKFLHIRQKVPILVSKQKQLLLFPTQSSESPNCVWINYGMVKNIKRYSDHETFVEFHDGTTTCIAMEYRSALRQVRFCFMFLYQLDLHFNQNLLDQVSE